MALVLVLKPTKIVLAIVHSLCDETETNINWNKHQSLTVNMKIKTTYILFISWIGCVFLLPTIDGETEYFLEATLVGDLSSFYLNIRMLDQSSSNFPIWLFIPEYQNCGIPGFNSQQMQTSLLVHDWLVRSLHVVHKNA